MQMFKKPLQTLLLGFALWICLLSVLYRPVFAATLAPGGGELEAPVQISAEAPGLKTGIDRFLTSIPSGYYTIGHVDGLKQQLKNPQTILVDVREPSEYRAGHIPNAINLPLRTLTHHLSEIPIDRPVILYCSSGYRSAMGVMTLHLLGYEKVQGFPPSFASWKTAGEAIVKESGDF